MHSHVRAPTTAHRALVPHLYLRVLRRAHGTHHHLVRVDRIEAAALESAEAAV